MIATANRVHRFGVLVFVGTLCLGAGNAFGDYYQGQPQPAPQAAAPMAQPATVGQGESVAVAQNAATNVDDVEFCGLPVCSPPGRFWMRGDYLMWWTSGTRLPPLVTTSPERTPQGQAGVLGQPGTTILYGGETVNIEGRSGVHTTLGMWLDCCHIWNLEVDYLSLGGHLNGFDLTSNGDPILARPYFNVSATGGGAQAAELAAYPGVVEGRVTAGTTDYFQSAGVLLSYNLCHCDSCCDPCDPCEALAGMNCCPPLLYCCRTDLLAGFRYYGLGDRLNVHEALDVPAGDLVGTTIDVQDNFSARNDFYGSELGLRTQVYRGRWSFEVLTKIAMGNTHEVANINGQTIVASPGQPIQTYNAGILAAGTNSGAYERDVFTVIPQLGVEVGYQVACHWRAYVGYNLLYWGDVWRSGDQVDLNLDPRNFPPTQSGGLPFPQFPGRSTSFWAQGVNIGTELRF
jgi:hypothetical protein